jgi:hypothetical protein
VRLALPKGASTAATRAGSAGSRLAGASASTMAHAESDRLRPFTYRLSVSRTTGGRSPLAPATAQRPELFGGEQRLKRMAGSTSPASRNAWRTLFTICACGSFRLAANVV